MWRLSDYSSTDEQGEQVFVSDSLTEASLRRGPLTVLCLHVCVSAHSAQMGLIETTRGLLPGAGESTRGHRNDPERH